MPFVSEEAATAAGASTARIAILFLLKASGGWIRYWSGVGAYTLPADLIDTVGGDYHGFGEVVGLPALSQLINGVAERVDFTLSGIEAEVLALADAEADTVRAAPVHLGLLVFDADYQPIGDAIWLWEGEADTPRVERSAADPQGLVVRTVSLSAGSIFTGRRRPRLSYFSGIDQRRRSADDAFADRANRYSQGTTRKWP